MESYDNHNKKGNNMVLLNNDITMKIKSVYCNNDDFLSDIIIEGEIWKTKKLLYIYIHVNQSY